MERKLVNWWVFTSSIIEPKHGNNIGLYRDDGLGAFEAAPQEVERIKKSICSIFKDNGLRITVEANLSTVNFLDVTFNLARNSFEPYAKPNSIPTYIHANPPTHPPAITANPIKVDINNSQMANVQYA